MEHSVRVVLSDSDTNRLKEYIDKSGMKKHRVFLAAVKIYLDILDGKLQILGVDKAVNDSDVIGITRHQEAV